MEQAKLKTACLGIDSRSLELLRAAERTGLFEIVSVADADMTEAEKAACRFSCTAFDDFRQFVLQNDVDILFAAEPLYHCMEYVKLAISKQTHILKLIPAAADFAQAGELIKMAAKNRVKYLTAVSARFAPGFERFCDYLKTIDKRQFYLLKAYTNLDVSVLETASVGKSADPKLLGGGVLLNDCFELVDQIVLNFSLPQQVYALTTNRSTDKRARQYLGEDTVQLSMKFTDGLIGSFIAAGHFGPALTTAPPLQIYGSQQNITVTSNRLAVYDTAGKILEDHKYPQDAEKCCLEMLIDLGRALLRPDEYKLRFGSSLDLATMAFIESAYLSERTAMPESPSRFFEITEHENFSFG